jgi:GntR family transcriptional regulator
VSVLPLYHRVFLALRDQIINGVYDTRKPMPSENALRMEYDVSRATIRKAMELLEEEGLVVRRQGARTYAKALGYKTAENRRNLESIARGEQHLELLPGEIQQHYEIITPDKSLSRQFNQPGQLGRVVRVREQNKKPYCFVVTYLPLEIADRISWEKLGSKPVITAAAEVGYDFAKTEQVITATVADEESSRALAVPVGSALLRISGLFIGPDEKPVMRKDGYFHPDSFEYRMTLYSKQSE